MAGLICLACLAGLAGCKKSDIDQFAALADRTDAASLDRLAALDENARVLLSIHGEQLDELPPLEDTDHQIDQYADAWLILMSKLRLTDLGEAKGIERLVVWGGEDAQQRLGPQLRHRLLQRLEIPAERGEPQSAIATFEDGSPGLADRLREMGAAVGSRTGGIVTLEAPVDAMLDILMLPELEKLTLPSILDPAPVD